MSQKIKSLLYLSCFIIAAIFYCNTSIASSQNDEIVDTPNNTHLDKMTISSFEEEEDLEDEEDKEEEKGKEY